MVSPTRHDRLVGLACVLACPTVTGVFLGLITALCVYPNDGGHPLAVATLVGFVAFLANALAIAMTAMANYGSVARPGLAGSASNRPRGRISR